MKREVSEWGGFDDPAMDIFRKIERSFAACRATRSFEAAVARWSRRWPAFAELAGPEGIAQARELGSRAMKDAIHTALCVEATQKPKDDIACLFLYWLFLPGLVAAADDLCSSETADFDDISGELFAGFLEAASKVSTESTYVARHLVRGARLRALTSLRKAETRDSIEEHVQFEVVSSDDPTDPSRLFLREAVRHGVVSLLEIEIIFVEREDLIEVASRRGLSPEAARQIKVRARQKLGTWLSESSRDPLVG